MKRHLLFFFSAILLGNLSNAQNLVPNPGFETHFGCPTSDGQINKATGWTDPTTTGPDYFNACATAGSGYSVPSNDLGDMAAHTGDAYAGFFTYFTLSFYTNVREYIQAPLSSTLEAGKTYTVSFYVARALASDYAASTIGAYFSSSIINPPSVCNGSIIPQVENPSNNVIASATAWTLVTGSFVAAGDEQYMTIGNFKTSANSNPVYEGGATSTGTAYYLIDDISVVKDEATAISYPANKVSAISIYPNPVSDKIYIDLPADMAVIEHLAFMMYDVTGKKIYCEKINSPEPQSISTSDLNPGLYFCKITVDDKEIFSNKILIIK